MWETWLEQWEAASGRLSYDAAMQLAQLSLATSEAISHLAFHALRDTVASQAGLAQALNRSADAKACTTQIASTVQEILACSTALQRDVSYRWQQFQHDAHAIVEQEQMLLGEGVGLPALKTVATADPAEPWLTALNTWLEAATRGFEQVGQAVRQVSAAPSEPRNPPGAHRN